MMRAYLRTRDTVTTAEIARRWEYRYGIGASAILLLLSIWCFIAFSRTNDPFAHLVSFSMTIAYAAGIFGRNFANPRFVIVQILCTWAPITAALVLYGNLFYWIFAALLDPVILRHQADRRPIAPNAARRRRHLARHVAAGETV